jgi:predicted nucleotidyltransferase
MLPTNEIEILKKIFNEVLGTTKYSLFYFGSRANATHRSNSDLDLLLDVAGEFSGFRRVSIEHELAESNLPYRVDLVLRSELDANFYDSIKNSLIRII